VKVLIKNFAIFSKRDCRDWNTNGRKFQLGPAIRRQKLGLVWRNLKIVRRNATKKERQQQYQQQKAALGKQSKAMKKTTAGLQGCK
jgi:hypothetical protein